MKIFVLAIAMFALNVYATRATSLDPVENAQMDDAENKSDDARTKRSGEIFSSLLKKKLGLLSSLTGGSSSGKSFEPFPEHYEEPLSYNTKSFNLWGVKKAILSSVLQAAKAITGGVIALKGNLITAKGHVVVAKGKLMQTKGQALSNFGKTIATHAFDSHSESPQFEHGGLFNHLPVMPVHQPTSYGATAYGYQQSYPVTLSHAYPSGNGYQVAARNHFAPTGFAVPQSGYDGGGGSEYPAYGGGAGYSAKRAVVNNAAAQESVINQVKNEFDKDSVRAGLLIFKPIKMPQNLPLSSAAAQSVRSQQVVGQRPAQSSAATAVAATAFPLTSLKSGFQNAFNRFQAAAASQTNGGADRAPANVGYQTGPTVGFQTGLAGGFQTPGQYAAGYSQLQNAGYPAAAFPATGGGIDDGESVENVPSQGFAVPNFADFPQVPGSQEFDRQLSGFPDQQQQQQQQLQQQQLQQQQQQQQLQQQQQHQQQQQQQQQKKQHQQERQQIERLKQERQQQERLERDRLQQERLQQAAAFFSHEHFGAGDQHDSASESEEHVVEPAYQRARRPEAAGPESHFAAPDFFLPTTPTYGDEANEGPVVKYPSTRSVANDHGPSARSLQPPSHDSIVPLQYQHNDSSAEEQARLKQTVHRFFDMLKKQS